MQATHAFSTLLTVLADRFSRHDSAGARELAQALCDETRAPQRTPATVPGCAALADALAQADTDLREVLSGALDELTWRVPGFGRLPETLKDRMAVVELLGPTGMLHHDRVSLGLILMAPDVAYPAHSHAADEVYLVLSGTLDWSIDSRQIGPVKADTFVHHKPCQRHAMATRDHPALMLWGWTGDIRGETYLIEPDTPMDRSAR